MIPFYIPWQTLYTYLEFFVILLLNAPSLCECKLSVPVPSKTLLNASSLAALAHKERCVTTHNTCTLYVTLSLYVWVRSYQFNMSFHSLLLLLSHWKYNIPFDRRTWFTTLPHVLNIKPPLSNTTIVAEYSLPTIWPYGRMAAEVVQSAVLCYTFTL